jgi:hypothetical protein
VPSELAQAVTRAAYGARQLPRVVWYIGHSLVLRELAARMHGPFAAELLDVEGLRIVRYLPGNGEASSEAAESRNLGLRPG